MKTFKTFFLVIYMSLSALLTMQAQIPDFEWAVRSGGDSTIMSYAMAVDPSGNQIITGVFSGTVDFDPGTSTEDTYYITSNGGDDIFIQKLDVNGNLLWAAGMGDIGNDRGNAVTTDASGNIYQSGYFIHSMDADPGTGVFTLTQTKYTAFVSKIAPDGNLVWAKQMSFPGDWGLAYGFGLALDNNLNVITAGEFNGRVDFDPGPGTFNMTHSGGSYDGYIQKLDNDGNFIWAKQIAGGGGEHINAVTADNSGNIYTSGSFTGTADFNPDKKLKFQMASAGSFDVFYQKLDANGSFVWAMKVGGASGDYGYVLHYDPVGEGALYSTGQFYGAGDYDPGSGTLIFTPVGACDLFLVKLDLNGNLSWAKQIGGPDWDSGSDIQTDAAGNVYLNGFFYGTTDFDPDPDASYFMTAYGGDDIFIFKSDITGNFLWAEHLGGTGYDAGLGLALDANGDILTAGVFQGTADFDPDGDVAYELTATGYGRDMVVFKLNSSGGDGCIIPEGLDAINISEISADLTWNPVTGATEYYVHYRVMATTDWTIIDGPITGTTVSLTGLTEATYYEFQVKTDCQSNYSYSGEFVTPGTACTDEYEPNNTISTSVQIPANTDLFGLIPLISDVDWFRINTTNSAKNLMIILSDLPADYNIRMQTGGGTILGISQNSGTTPDTIIYNSRQAGLYYIYVYGYAGEFDPNDCYTLRANVSNTQYTKSDPVQIFVEEVTEELIIYPNPTNSTFNFRLETNSKESVTIQLFDLSGRLVQEYHSLSPDNIITVGDNLNNGVYIAVITQGTLRKIVKIAKVQ